VANVQAMAGPHSFQCTPEDYCVSWLPLYHDMGLVAKVLMPIYVGMRGGLFMPPGLFLTDPIAWLRQISACRGTLTFAPNFAYSLCTARASERAMQGIDLTCLRVAACAAEPIRSQVLTAFARTFAPYGLRPEALVPCYGLAEHTLGATISPIGTGMTIDRVDATALTQGVAIPTPAACGATTDRTTPPQGVAEVVSCGRFLAGHTGKIVDPDGNPVPQRTIGEIWLCGPSVMQDYFEDSAATAATLSDGWLHTGDLGYLADGLLYVCGRSKDVLILYGCKYHPQDIEWEAEQVQGIRRGCVVAFGLENPALNRDRVVIAAETTLPSAHYEQLQNMIRARIHQELPIMVDEVLLVPPHTLPKTSSGKLQRARARALFQSDQLAQSSQQV
jgi:fatty-acyl-CoA synthase